MNYFVIRSMGNPTPQPLVDVSAQRVRVQEARLFAALLEAGWGLKVNQDQAEALQEIRYFFPINLAAYSGENVHEIPIFIDHAAPTTRFGDIVRPLIFPKWLVGLGSSANFQKKHLTSFEGFPNVYRVNSTLNFIETNFGSISRLKKQLVATVNRTHQSALRTNVLNVLFARLVSHDRALIKWTFAGRRRENKVVDRAYWATLNHSLTVYCPDGDFGWTYRFYEAMLAGALPVLDVNGDRAFAEPFRTVCSVNEATSVGRRQLAEITAFNRTSTLATVTAYEQIKPERFV